MTNAKINRSEAEWAALEDATVTVYGFRAGRTLTDDDIAALNLVDTCRREDEESATEAYHNGLEEGLRERGGDELVKLNQRVSEAIVERATEKAMRAFAEQDAEAANDRATSAEARVAVLEGLLREAASVLRMMIAPDAIKSTTTLNAYTAAVAAEAKARAALAQGGEA